MILAGFGAGSLLAQAPVISLDISNVTSAGGTDINTDACSSGWEILDNTNTGATSSFTSPGGRVMSMTLTLLNPQDGVNEQLSVGGTFPGVLVSGNGTQVLTITNTGAASTNTMRTVLDDVIYKDLASNPNVVVQRQVSVQVTDTLSQASNTAIAYFFLQKAASSGNAPGPIIVFPGAPNVNLFTGLDGSEDAGGTWVDVDGTGALTGNMVNVAGLPMGGSTFRYDVTAASPCGVSSTNVLIIKMNNTELPMSSPSSCGVLETKYTDATYSGNSDDPIYLFNTGTSDGQLECPAGAGPGTIYDWYVFNPTTNSYDAYALNSTPLQSNMPDGGYLVVRNDGGTITEGRAWVWNVGGVLPDAGPDGLVCAGDTYTLNGNIGGLVQTFTHYDPVPRPLIIGPTTEIRVTFDALHTYVSDLGFYAIAPDGISTVVLGANQGNTCNSGDNITNLSFTANLGGGVFNFCSPVTAPLTGQYQEYFLVSNQLIDWSPFYGFNAHAGGWAVQIYDCVAQDIGSLTGASIVFDDGAGNIATYTSGSISVPINDNSCTPATASIYVVPSNAAVSASQTLTIDPSIGVNDTTGGWQWYYSTDGPTGPFVEFNNSTLSPTLTVNEDTWVQMVVNNGVASCNKADVMFIQANVPPNAGLGSTVNIVAGAPAVTLANLLTGEDGGGTWSLVSGTPGPGAFNAGAGTLDPGISGVGNFVFRYTVSGNPPCTDDTEDVTVVVYASTPPVAGDDNGPALQEEGSGGSVNLIVNDTDVDGNPSAPVNGAGQFTVDLDLSMPGIQVSVTDPQGTWTLNPATGEVTFVPAANFNGTATTSYILCDPAGACDTALISFVVNPVNDPPVAQNDSLSIPEDSSNVAVVVIGNDDDPNDPLGNIDPATLDTIPGGGPSNGTVTFNTTTGAIIYTPDPDFHGTDTVTYVICDDGNPLPAACDTAMLVFTVDPVNDAPVAVNDTASVGEDSPGTTVSLVGNDSDPTDPLGNIDPATLDTIPGNGPQNGTVTINTTTGEVTYTPNPNFVGMDSLQYVICDDGNPLPAACDTAWAFFNVTPVNDPPVAMDDALTIPEDTANVTLVVIGNDDDPNDPLGNIDPATLDTIPGGGPSNGTISINTTTGAITYTPNPNFNGNDTITYVICDDGNPLPAACDTAMLVFTVDPVNDAPVAVNDTASVGEDSPGSTISLVGNDSDPTDPLGNIDPATLDTIPGNGPQNGTVTINTTTGEVTYTPNPNFVGMDSLQYVICDDGNPLPAACDTAWAFFNVTPVNDPPVAMDDALTIPEDTANVTVVVISNDDDPNDPLGNIDPATLDTIPGGGPANGTISINTTTGAIIYTPNPNFNGNDTITYVICDDGNPLPAACDTAMLVFTVDPLNDAPIAVNDTANISENSPGSTISLVGNDDDPLDPLGNIDPATLDTIPGNGPQNGTVTINTTTGEVTYTPNPGFNGTDSLQYVICDDGNPLPAACDTAWAYFNVTPVNDPPVALNDSLSIPEDTSNVTVVVISNDDDPNDPLGNIDPATLDTIPGGGPANGTISINTTTGAITYTPNPNFNGNDTITYVICDDGNPLPAACDTAMLVFTVDPLNDAPIAVNDTVTMPEDTTNVTLSLVGNDSDPSDPLGNVDPTTLDTIPGNGPQNGTVTINTTTGEVTYTPNPNFNGTDSLQYVICDNGNPLPAMCDTAWAYFHVVPSNDPPVAVNDRVLIPEDTASTTVVVIANDDDPNDPLGSIDPSTLDTIPGGGPLNGTITIDTTTGAITYVPNPNFNGLDSVVYVICDNGYPLPAACDTATLIFNVKPVNDPPLALNDTVMMAEDTSNVTLSLVGNDSDALDPLGSIDPSTLDTIPGNGPQNGTVTLNTTTGEVTYTPNPGFNGTDSLQYVICDNGNPMPAACDTAWAFFQVAPVNDPPVALDDIVTISEDTTATTVTVIANDDDPNDPFGNIDPATLDTIPGGGPSNGTITIDTTTGAITYIPNPNFNGSDTITYVICDNGNPLPAACDTAMLIFNVSPVNDPPLALNDSASTSEENPVVINPTGNDTDPFDPFGGIDPTSVDTIPGNGPQNGTVVINPLTGEITYTPNPNFWGTDSLQYVVCDSGNPLPPLCDTAWVYLQVSPDNDAPIAATDSVTVMEDDTVQFNPTGNDVDPDPNGGIDGTTVTVVTPPGNGTYTVGPNGTITYTPGPDFCGLDSLQYSVCDSGFPLPVLCDSAWAYFEVICVNDPPVATTDTIAFGNDQPGVVITVLGNDTDLEMDSLMVTAIPCQPANGTATITAGGDINYQPNPGFVGMDTLCYIVCDTGTPQGCDTAWVYVNVLNFNDPPVAANDTATTPAATLVVIDVLGNDTDPDGDSLIVTAITCGPSNGVAFIADGDSIVYIPNGGFVGADTICYVVCDNFAVSECDTAIVVISVYSTNLPPVAGNDSTTISQGGNGTVVVLFNDSDPDQDSLSVVIFCPPGHGTAILNSDGTIQYIPDPSYYGPDSLCYIVCDNGVPGLCDTGWVYFDVRPENGVVIPNGFSPNGDGDNDFLEIPGIENYPDNHLMVFNRWGNEIFAAEGYLNEWDGRWQKNDALLPDGTYFYVLDLGDGTRPRSGYLVIFR